MRTTLDIADDVLLAVKEVARRDKTSVGQALSNIARKALLEPPTATRAGARQRSARSAELEAKLRRLGIHPLPGRGVVVTNEIVNRIRDEEGI